MSGRELLALKSVDALESIPLVFAEKTGMSIIDAQVQAHAKKQ